jgi:hypothetical protein
MRLRVTPDGPLEHLAMSSGMLPVPLVAAFWGMGLSRVLISGARLGIFDTLAAGPLTAREVAEATGTDPAGMETMLNALNGFGYVTRHDGRYANTAETAKWLVSGSKDSVAHAMWFFDDLWDAVGAVEEGVRTGVPLDFHDPSRPPEFWDRYMRTLAQFAGITDHRRALRLRCRHGEDWKFIDHAYDQVAANLPRAQPA